MRRDVDLKNRPPEQTLQSGTPVVYYDLHSAKLGSLIDLPIFSSKIDRFSQFKRF